MKIRAEVEWEIAQLEQQEMLSKRSREKKKKSQTKRSSSTKGDQSSTPHTCSSSRCCENPSKMIRQSQCKGTRSASQSPSRFSSAPSSGSKPKTVASCASERPSLPRKGTKGSRAKQANFATREKCSPAQQDTSQNDQGRNSLKSSHPRFAMRKASLASPSKERARQRHSNARRFNTPSPRAP